MEVNLPNSLYETDSAIALNVVKEKGPTAVLNEIYVFGEPRPESDPTAGGKFTQPRSWDFSIMGPMPFKHSGRLLIAVPKASLVQVDVYDISGRRVQTLWQGVAQPGYHVISFNGKDRLGRTLPDGVYIVQLKAGSFRKILRIVWLQ